MAIHPNQMGIFLSYAHKDKVLLKELEKFLKPLRGIISIWSDQEIVPGGTRNKSIDQHLEQASIILLLISPNFLASHDCVIEMQRALVRDAAGLARVIPVMIRPISDPENAPFAHLQALPVNTKAISTWRDKDKAFVDVVDGIRKAIKDLSPQTTTTNDTIRSSIWNVPYQRNPFFVGREEVLSQVHQQLEANQAQPQALSGLGGVGKTQVAIEYAYRHLRDYQAILWGNADTRENLITALVALAHLLSIPQKDEQDPMVVVEAVKGWLVRHDNWLLILDNADKLALVQELIPPTFRGHLLLTTRTQIVGPLAYKIEIESMKPEEGALLLLRRSALLQRDDQLSAALSSDIAAAKEISEELGGLPLALDQAGAYIEAKPKSLPDYLQLYRTQKSALLKQRGDEDTPGGVTLDHPESVTITFSLSFENIERENPAAAALLQFCAFLASDPIPEEIIIKGCSALSACSFKIQNLFKQWDETYNALTYLVQDEMAFDRVIGMSRSYSLIQRDTKTKTLSVHRLVQVVLKDRINKQGQRQWAKHIVKALAIAASDIPSHEILIRGVRLLPHALACVALIEQENFQDEIAAFVLLQSAIYLSASAILYDRAESLYLRVRTISRNGGVSYHDIEASAIHNLAMLYIRRGRYEQGISLLLPLINANPYNASYLMNLAVAYIYQEKFAEAEALFRHALAFTEFRRALASSENDDDPESLLTAAILTSLGGLYVERGMYDLAEQSLVRALSIKEKALGQGHLDTVICLSSLASMYHLQGKYEQAESFSLRALTIIEQQQFGSEHPNNIGPLATLTELYREQEKYEQAELHAQRALTIIERQLGPEHPSIIEFLNKLGLIYDGQNKDNEAEMVFKRGLTISERLARPEASGVALLLSNLAQLYRKQKKYKEAELLTQRSIAIWEQQRGPEHPTLGILLANLAYLYRLQGKYKEAEPLYERALMIAIQKLGPQHPTTIHIIDGVMTFYAEQEKYEQIAKLLDTLGLQHIETIIHILNSVMISYAEQEKYEDAVKLLKNIYFNAIPQDSFDIDCLVMSFLSFNKAATSYLSQGNFPLIERVYQLALEITEQKWGLRHVLTSLNLNNLAQIYYMQEKYQQAKELSLRALKNLDEEGPEPEDENSEIRITETIKALIKLSEIYRKQDQYEDAEPLLRRALATSQRLSPVEGLPFIVTILNNLAALYFLQEKYDEVESLAQQSLTLLEKQLETEPLIMLRCLSLVILANLYRKQGKYEQAEELLKRCLAICESQVEPESSTFSSILNSLAVLYRSQEKYDQAKPLFQKALTMAERVFGPHHSLTKGIRDNYKSLLEEIEIKEKMSDQNKEKMSDQNKEVL